MSHPRPVGRRAWMSPRAFVQRTHTGGIFLAGTRYARKSDHHTVGTTKGPDEAEVLRRFLNDTSPHGLSKDDRRRIARALREDAEDAYSNNEHEALRALAKRVIRGA